jgi:16S rRNA (cytosine1402-N4)-methyltransferase
MAPSGSIPTTADALAELTTAPGRPHQPVMAEEVVRLLAPAPGATIVDCTFGAGGHAARLAPALGPGGCYIAIDRDPTVAEHVEALAASVECRVRFLRRNMADALPDLVAEGVRADALLMDLGLSSMQVDRPERGFSYSRQAPLDMRMDPGQPRSAADLVAEAGEAELAGIFRVLGEERHAGAIARAIVRRRATAALLTTADLVEVIRSALPTPALFAGGHPAKRVFQALRIAVNDELASLATGLAAGFDLLTPDGRMAVLAFHSLEDRLVKRFVQERTRGCICPPELPVCGCGRVPRAKSLTPRALRPGREELDRNPRSRSARLRALTRTGAR